MASETLSGDDPRLWIFWLWLACWADFSLAYATRGRIWRVGMN